jgi:WD40 repeat protein
MPAFAKVPLAFWLASLIAALAACGNHGSVLAQAQRRAQVTESQARYRLERVFEQDRKGHPTNCDVSPDSKLVAVAEREKPLAAGRSYVRVIELETGSTKKSFEVPMDLIRLVRFSPHGREILVAAWNYVTPESNSAIFRCRETGVERLVEFKPPSWIMQLDYSEAGKPIAAIARDGQLVVRDVTTGGNEHVIDMGWPVAFGRAAFTLHLRSIVITPSRTRDRNSDCKVARYLLPKVDEGWPGDWETTGHSCLPYVPDADGISFALSDDGSVLASGDSGDAAESISVWDLKAGTKLSSVKIRAERNPVRIFSMDFSPQNDLLAISTYNHSSTGVWNARSGEVVQEMAHVSGIAQFSPDGKLLIVVTFPNFSEYKVMIWKIVRG